MYRYLNNFLSLVSANFISNIISVITFPIFLSRIGLEQYGNWMFLFTIISISSIFLHFGTDAILNREIAAKRLKAKIFLRNVIGLKFLLFISIGTLIYLYNVFLNPEPESLIKQFFYIYVLPTLFFTVYSNEALLNANELFKQSSILKLVNQSIYTFSIIFFVKQPSDLYFAAIGVTAGNFISISMGWLILTLKGYSPKPMFKPQASIKILKKSYFYFLSSIASLTYNRFGIIISKLFLTDYELGLYTATTKFIEIILEFLNIIPKPLGPRIVLLIEQKKNYLELVTVSFKICILTFVPISIGVFILKNDLIFLILGQKDYKSITLISFLIPSLIFCPFSVFFANLLVAFKKHTHYLFSVIVGAIISVIASIILMFLIGIKGIAISYTISHFCIMIINYTLIRKKLKGFLDSDSYKLKIQLILLFIYAFIIIYSMSLIFNNIILSIGLSILVYVPAMISVLKKDFKTINNFNDN